MIPDAAREMYRLRAVEKIRAAQKILKGALLDIELMEEYCGHVPDDVELVKSVGSKVFGSDIGLNISAGLLEKKLAP
ncbi:MAG: hypothetical protein QG671_3702 [Actinomycetota bacterium]|nr:hypothetical protein [Actinomycetota bacterium]